nr:MAG TPA: hypothetical protein [Caudoviricetes sp.]
MRWIRYPSLNDYAFLIPQILITIPQIKFK